MVNVFWNVETVRISVDMKWCFNITIFAVPSFKCRVTIYINMNQSMFMHHLEETEFAMKGMNRRISHSESLKDSIIGMIIHKLFCIGEIIVQK